MLCRKFSYSCSNTNVFLSLLAACTHALFRLLYHSGLLVRKPHPPRASTLGARFVTSSRCSQCRRSSFRATWVHIKATSLNWTAVHRVINDLRGAQNYLIDIFTTSKATIYFSKAVQRIRRKSWRLHLYEGERSI